MAGGKDIHEVTNEAVGRVIARTERDIIRAYSEMIRRVLKKLPLVNMGFVKGDGKTWEDLRKHPMFRKALHEEVERMTERWEQATREGIGRGWWMGERESDAIVDGYFAGRSVPRGLRNSYKHRNNKALQAFLKRGGGFYSRRVWQEGERVERHLCDSISEGLSEGMSAQKLSRKIREDLRYPDKLFRRVRNKYGELVLSKNARAFHPGQGVYRSSYKNAMRLARTEINTAYRTADHERWQELDFVKGIRVSLSNNHTCNGVPFRDICDDLQGVYPKGFKFTGWHPQCYSDDSSVLTDTGWKLFNDVEISDKILSLNPDTMECEWVGISDRQKYHRDGEMIRFYNRTLDCLVTPEHEMVYLNKYDGSIMRSRADEFSVGKGAFYRGCNWTKGSDKDILIGERHYKLLDFAEFMGYWLADGSVAMNREKQISIAQQLGDKNREPIIACIERMGLTPRAGKQSIYIFDKSLCGYLRQFGKCSEKFVPNEIKNAGRDVIKAFLNAYVSCDGHVREPKSFIGNRGTVFNGKRKERVFYTTSNQLASDIGELMLKIGSRPSYYVDRRKGTENKFSNGTYTINYDLIRISECYSKTATVFNKEIVRYKGYVYDLTLERNHIMYIQRNGKCFWGSNCRCIATPIMEDFEEFLKRKINGGEARKGVEEVPKNFKEWVRNNGARIEEAGERGKLPYFLNDNKELWINTHQNERITKLLDGKEPPIKHTKQEIVVADPKRFRRAIAKEKIRNKNGWMVDVHDDYSEEKCFLTKDGKAGVAVTKDGDIVSLFSSVGGDHRSEKLIMMAIENGGCKCDCYGGGLENIYRKFGAEAVGRVKFNREYAPDAWKLLPDGDPRKKEYDVVAMIFPKSVKESVDLWKSLDTIKLSEVKLFGDYDEMIKFRDSLLD